jgi:UDP-N-acetylglucosamine diphosphorylase/glucosamine-1-phosphate N-acetyltransferase
MKEIVLDEAPYRENLFPFTLTRGIADIRVGILTIREKWENFFHYRVTDAGMAKEKASTIQANIIPNKKLVDFLESGPENLVTIPADIPVNMIEYPWQIFELNDREIRNDFQWITQGRVSAPISPTNRVLSPETVFLEPGAKVEHATLNASTGPIYVAKDAEVMEGAMIRGPFALCEGAQVRMGAMIYGASTIGPWSVAGGEIKNSVLFSHSNKAHTGYLGDSVIGSWCNLGAGTTNSNLKNNASGVNIWNPYKKAFLSAGLKCGLLMGDFSRSAINTSFNTGTIVGTCANVFYEGLTPAYIQSFAWGKSAKYEFEKAIQHISRWKKMKNEILTEAEIRTLKHIFEQL